MFVPNNDRIDYPELQRRLDQAVSGLASPPSAPEAEPPPPEPAEPPSPAPQPRSSRLGRLVAAVLHAPTVLRRVVAAVRGVEDLQARVQQLELDVRARRDQVDQLSAMARARLATNDAAITGLFGRAAELRGHMDAKLAELLGATGDTTPLAQRIALLRGEVMIQQQRLTRLAAAGPAIDAGTPVSHPPSILESTRHDSLYAAFEDVFRGTRADIRQRLAVHVDRLAAAGVGQRDKPVVDIGCGRGEWLDLLREHGMTAYGIDSNTIMVDRCIALGLDARHADLLGHLRGLGDASRSAVTAFHVVEHLPFDVLVDFFDEALRVLAPGGLLLIETPNPETLRVGGTTFYNDPTHRNPLMPGPLRFIIEHRGFTAAEIIRLHPFTSGLLQEPTADAAVLNEVLFGPQDYAIAARRP